MRCGRDKPLTETQLGMMLILLGASSEKPDTANCECVGVVVLIMLDKMLSSKIGLQFTSSVHELQVEKLFRKSN